MSLRITQGILYDRALQDIHSGLFRYSRLQAQVASGKRINRPSDDPTAALRMIPLGNDIRNLEQLRENVSLAREVLNTGASALEGGSQIMQRLRELAMQAGNATLNDSDRAGIAAEVDELLRQMVGIGNTSRAGRFLFAGTANDAAPFELMSQGGTSRVSYEGNRERLSVEVAPAVHTELNVPGDRIFQSRNRGATTFRGDGTGVQPRGIGDTGVGFQTLQVTFNGLHTDAPSTVTAGTGSTTALGPLAYTFTAVPPTLRVGTGPAVPIPASNTNFSTGDGRSINLTVTGVPATLTGTFTSKAGLSTDGGATRKDVSNFGASNVQVLNSQDGTVLNVDVSGLTRTGSELVKYEGTFDSFTILIAMRDLLRNTSGIATGEARDRISGLLGEIDSAHEGILDGIRELGFRTSSMDMLSDRVQSLQISRTESLSLVQDTDLAEAILALQRQDIAYQASLQVTSRVMQTTLAGLLR